MDGVKVIREEQVTLPLDAFYFAVHAMIDDANPRPHLSADYVGDPLGFGLTLFPLKVYEKMRELKEASHG